MYFDNVKVQQIQEKTKHNKRKEKKEGMQQCEYPNLQNVELQNIIEKGKKIEFKYIT